MATNNSLFFINGKDENLRKSNEVVENGIFVNVIMGDGKPYYKIGNGKSKYTELPLFKGWRNIGLFFGTFNPVHNGHIDIAKQIIINDKNCIEEVWFVPSVNIFHKNNKDVVSFSDRLNMLIEATKNETNISCTDIENRIVCENYTYNVLNDIIKNEHSFNEYYLIMGADNFISIETWYNAEKLLKEYPIFVLNRNDLDISAKVEDIKRKYEVKNVQILTDIDEIKISSTEIREKISNKESISDLLPNSVIDYIRQNKLYGMVGDE